MSKCGWEGYNDEFEAHLAKKHPEFPVRKTDGSNTMKWTVKEGKIADGGCTVSHQGVLYILRWEVTADYDNINEVDLFLTTFDEKERTDFILKFIDEDMSREYTLKATTYVKEDGMANKETMTYPCLSIPQSNSKNRYMTLEFLDKK